MLKALFTAAKARGVTLIDLAGMVERDAQRLSEYRTGKVEPGVHAVEAMAAALGFDVVLQPRENKDEKQD